MEKQLFKKINKQTQEILIHNKRQFPVSHKDKQFYEIHAKNRVWTDLNKSTKLQSFDQLYSHVSHNQHNTALNWQEVRSEATY